MNYSVPVKKSLSFWDMVAIGQFQTKELKVAYMLEAHFAQELIAKYVHVSKTTIQEIKGRLYYGRLPRTSSWVPKKKICQDEIERLRIQYPHLSDARIADMVTRNIGVQISRATVNRVAHFLKFNYLPMRRKQNLTPTQVNKRVLFARRVVKDGLEGGRIVFSDESRFVLGTDKRWVWRRRGEEVDEIYEQTDKFPKSVMIFGAIGKNYKSDIVLIKGTIGAVDYQRILEDSKVISYMSEDGNENLVFQQDGASCHTASAGYVRKHCNLLGNWPANSPDLNVIEHLWAIMKERVAEVQPDTQDALIEVIKGVWDNISIPVINHLIDSFEKRCALVLQRQGETLNGHFEDACRIPRPEEVEQIFGVRNDDLDTVVLPKFTDEEIRAYDEAQRRRTLAPQWDAQKDNRLIKYIIEQNLSYAEAARRLQTSNVESVRQRMTELLADGGIVV